MAKTKSKASVAAASTETAASVSEYQALTPIRHDGDNYAVGESIELTDDQAKQLLELNAVKALPAKAPAPAPEQPPVKPEEDGDQQTTQTDPPPAQ